jgi:drug/metabolite transporter (DMT)-like permease
MSRHALLAPALLLLTAVLWSLGGVLIKSIDAPPMAIAAIRSVIALPVVLAFAGWPERPFSHAQIGGAVAYSATVILFVLATRLTTAANAIFIQYTAPLYVAALAPWWLGERSHRSDWLFIAVALGGIALFFLDQLSFAGLWGNVCALASGVAFAATALFLRQERSGSPMTVIVLGNALTAVVGLPFAFSASIPSASWVPLVLIGVVQLGLPYVLYAIAIRRVTALEATLLPLLEPVLNPLWVMLVIGETPGPWAALGAAVVLGAVLLRGVLIATRRSPGVPAAEPAE